MKKSLLSLFFWLLFALPLFAAQLIISKPEVYLKNGFLMSGFKVQAHLGKKEIKTLQSGLTTTIRIKVELWEKGRILRRLKAAKEFKREISFDIWEKIYTLVRSEGKASLQFESYQELKQALAKKEAVSLLPLEALSPLQRYFVRVRVRVESINKQETQEIERWVNGSEGLINIGGLLSFFIKQKTKSEQFHARSDYFIPSKLPKKEQ